MNVTQGRYPAYRNRPVRVKKAPKKQLPLANVRIMIDPGHGGKFTGAVGPTGYREKTATLEISEKLKDKLTRMGATVRMTRTTDSTVAHPGASQSQDLRARVTKANSWPAQLFISVHCNSATSSSAHGHEIYHKRSPDSGSRRLATAINGEMAKKLDLRNRGVKAANFHVIKNTRMPGVLVETAFISNPKEERLLKDSRFQDLMAEAIASGVATYQAATHGNIACG